MRVRQSFSGRLFSDGAIAQLGERLLCKQEVVGSIPSGSTTFRGWKISQSENNSARCEGGSPFDIVKEAVDPALYPSASKDRPNNNYIV